MICSKARSTPAASLCASHASSNTVPTNGPKTLIPWIRYAPSMLAKVRLKAAMLTSLPLQQAERLSLSFCRNEFYQSLQLVQVHHSESQAFLTRPTRHDPALRLGQNGSRCSGTGESASSSQCRTVSRLICETTHQIRPVHERLRKTPANDVRCSVPHSKFQAPVLSGVSLLGRRT